MNSSDLAYKRLINDRIDSLTKSIDKLESRKKLFVLGRFYTLKLEKMKAEREDLENEVANFTHRDNMGEKIEAKMVKGNEKHAENDKKIDLYNRQIASFSNRLQTLKNDRNTKKHQRQIDTLEYDIQRLSSVVSKLVRKNIRIEKSQGRVMSSYFNKAHHNARVTANVSGTRNYFKERLKSNQEKINKLGNGIVDWIQEKYYNVVGMYYKYREDKEKEIIEGIQRMSHGTPLTGARRMRTNNIFNRPLVPAAAGLRTR